MNRIVDRSVLTVACVVCVGLVISASLLSCGSKDPVSPAPAPTLTWRSVSSPTSEDLLAGWGASSSDVFAAGANGVIVHFDGSNWATQSSQTLENLNGLWGTDGNNVIAVGNGGAVRLYNGTSWSEMTNYFSSDIHDVWGSAANNVYAVGSDGVVQHFSGSGSWGKERSITIRGQTGIWGAAADYIVTVGETSTIFHYNAVDWAFGSNENVKFLQTADRRGIRRFAPDAPFLLSFLAIKAGTEDRTVLDFDITPLNSPIDAAWLDLSLQNLDDGGTPGNINIYSFEGDGTIVADEFFWGSFATQFPFNDANGVTSVALTSTVQTALNSNYDYLALRMSTTTSDRYNMPYSNGAYPTLLVAYTPSPPTLNSVWGSADDDIFAVGTGGTILHYDGSSWSAQPSGTNVSLNCVWGTSANNVFAVGDDGTILRYNGSAWGTHSSGTSEHLMAVWGSAPNDIYAFGANGTILNYGP